MAMYYQFSILCLELGAPLALGPGEMISLAGGVVVGGSEEADHPQEDSDVVGMEEGGDGHPLNAAEAGTGVRGIGTGVGREAKANREALRAADAVLLARGPLRPMEEGGGIPETRRTAAARLPPKNE